MKVAYCTGFWCTNIGNSFFSLGVEHVLKNLLGADNVTVVSDFQTYTNAVGKRLYPHKNQLEYVSDLNVDCLCLAGPVLSKYFLGLWRDILIKLHSRGVKYAILSAGMMKMDDASKMECQSFFKDYPPHILCTRDNETFEAFGEYAVNAYNGICFSFFAPDYYAPCTIGERPYWLLNFDKMREPELYAKNEVDTTKNGISFTYDNKSYIACQSKLVDAICKKTDRYTDSLIYIMSMLPAKKRRDSIGDYDLLRTDNRFHPHYRSKIYGQSKSFCSDVPYGYLNLLANSSLTLSDRVHSCAVTMAFGHPAMLFVSTNRVGLLDRVGVADIHNGPVNIDMDYLADEKRKMCDWLKIHF